MRACLNVLRRLAARSANCPESTPEHPPASSVATPEARESLVSVSPLQSGLRADVSTWPAGSRRHQHRDQLPRHQHLDAVVGGPPGPRRGLVRLRSGAARAAARSEALTGAGRERTDLPPLSSPGVTPSSWHGSWHELAAAAVKLWCSWGGGRGYPQPRRDILDRRSLARVAPPRWSSTGRTVLARVSGSYLLRMRHLLPR